MRKLNSIYFFNWLLVFSWMGVIYYFSDQPNLQSNLQPIWDMIARKIAHIAEYFVLAYLLWRAFNPKDESKGIVMVFVFGLTLLYAISDEYHQQFVAGRQGSIVDVLIDSIGAGLFVIMQKFSNLLRLK